MSLAGNLFVVADKALDTIAIPPLSHFCDLWCGVGDFSFCFFYHSTFSTAVAESVFSALNYEPFCDSISVLCSTVQNG